MVTGSCLRSRTLCLAKNRRQVPGHVRLPVEFESSFESVIQSFLGLTPVNEVSPTLANSSNSLSEYLPVPLGGRQLLWPTGKIVPKSFHQRDLFGCRHLFDGNLSTHRAFSKYQWTVPVIPPRKEDLSFGCPSPPPSRSKRSCLHTHSRSTLAVREVTSLLVRSRIFGGCC